MKTVRMCLQPRWAFLGRVSRTWCFSKTWDTYRLRRNLAFMVKSRVGFPCKAGLERLISRIFNPALVMLPTELSGDGTADLGIPLEGDDSFCRLGVC